MEIFVGIFFGSLLLLPLVLLLKNNQKQLLGVLVSLLLGVASTAMACQAFVTGHFEFFLFKNVFLGNFIIEIDRLSAIFIIITNFTTFLASIYAVGFLKNYQNPVALSMQTIALAILHFGMLAVCMFQHWFAFLVVWEIMMLASFFGVILEYDRKPTLVAGINYLVQMHIGVSLLMVAVSVVYAQTHSLHFNALETFFKANSNYPVFLLFFIGFGLKAGLVPFHSWMPRLYRVAPAHILAVMSGVMVKIGLYGILRVLTYVKQDFNSIGVTILIVGTISVLYGIINAIMQRNLKLVLSYSSIENVGIICIGIGMGMIGMGNNNYPLAFLGFISALIHILNHSMFKSVLFFTVGSVYTATGTKNMEKLGGLIKRMPFTSIIFLVAAMAISGLPPLNGFISEFLLYEGIFKGLKDATVSIEVVLLFTLLVLVLAGGLSLYAFTKTFGVAFLGAARSEKSENAKEVSKWMLIPEWISIAGLAMVVFFPTVVFQTFSEVVHLFVPKTTEIEQLSIAALNKDELVDFIFIGLVVIIFGIRTYFVKKNKESVGATWGCGYLAGNTKMQYTSNSFANYLTKLAKPLVGHTVTYKEIPENDIFPTVRSFETQTHDVVEVELIEKPVSFIQKYIEKLAVIETGKTQNYILYSFIFLVILLLFTFAI
jgi:hydrogenase-4 component B